MDIREELKDEVSENTLKKRRKYYLKHGVNNLFPAGFLEDLTKEQEGYFKDSKIRDEKGNLLVCYHGTVNPGFKEFNAPKGKSQFGEYKFRKYNVNYFTTSKETARGYTKLGIGDVYACYLNVVNPYIVNNETEDDIKSWRNIKDKNVRNKEIKAFDKIFTKWCDNFPIVDDLDEINKDFYPFGYEFRLKNKDDELIDVYKLPDNSYFGNEERVLSSYYLFELFDKDGTTLKDTIIGEEDDYYLNNDDIVRWVIYMNENEGTNYDGIIIPDILDVGPSGSPFSENTTDIITLKSSNQIKLIDNKNPTSSNRIDEDKEEISTYIKNNNKKIIIEKLEDSTSYMLRKDGELLECGDKHPYIKEYYNDTFEQTLKYLDNHKSNLKWFYDNTLNDEVKELINEYKESEEKLERLYYLTNGEFCRVRTSNYRYKIGGDNGEIYFRLSSLYPQWFDIIWETCLTYKPFIKYITIMKDPQTSGKQFEYLKIKDIPINKYPVDDFINLETEVIVESLNESVEKDKEWYRVKETGEIGFKKASFGEFIILQFDNGKCKNFFLDDVEIYEKEEKKIDSEYSAYIHPECLKEIEKLDREHKGKNSKDYMDTVIDSIYTICLLGFEFVKASFVADEKMYQIKGTDKKVHFYEIKDIEKKLRVYFYLEGKTFKFGRAIYKPQDARNDNDLQLTWDRCNRKK